MTNQEMTIDRKRDEIVEQMKQQLDEWNDQLDELERRVEMTQGDARAEYERRLTNLKVRRRDFRERLNRLQAASMDAWSQLRQGAEAAWGEMRQALDDAGESFREEEAETT